MSRLLSQKKLLDEIGTLRLKSVISDEISDSLCRIIIESSDRRNELNAIMNGSKAVLEQKGFTNSARAIFDCCIQLIGASSGYVALLSETGEENEVLFLEAGGLPCDVNPELPMPIRGLRAEAYQTNQAVYDNDFMSSRWVEFMPKGHVVLKNVMFAPLIINEKTVGIMGLANKPSDFTDNDAKMATEFGTLAAIALQHNRNLDKRAEAENRLVEANNSLTEALAQLKKTQAQMLQSEKMASIGQLSAGIAHEINNPVGFISSNLEALTDYFNDVEEILQLYHDLQIILSEKGHHAVPDDVREKLNEIIACGSNIDIDYLREDIPEVLADCKEGTHRVTKIVQDLKSFAHPGREKQTDIKINECLKSTLNVIHNEIKYKAVVKTNFGQIPVCFGFPQKLGQVFMNIIVNAAQAVEKDGIIEIETMQDGAHVVIRITDNGCGIQESDISKIFDPFFTTKEIGQGSGLGLHICYNIIQEHKGSIQVKSQVGMGTCFTINLPVSS